MAKKSSKVQEKSNKLPEKLQLFQKSSFFPKTKLWTRLSSFDNLFGFLRRKSRNVFAQKPKHLNKNLISFSKEKFPTSKFSLDTQDALLKTLSKNSSSKFGRDFTKICNHSRLTSSWLCYFDEPPAEIRRKSEIINSTSRKIVSFF